MLTTHPLNGNNWDRPSTNLPHQHYYYDMVINLLLPSVSVWNLLMHALVWKLKKKKVEKDYKELLIVFETLILTKFFVDLNLPNYFLL